MNETYFQSDLHTLSWHVGETFCEVVAINEDKRVKEISLVMNNCFRNIRIPYFWFSIDLIVVLKVLL